MAKGSTEVTAGEARNAIHEGRCPEGAEVWGDLDLLDASWLVRLPKGLKVKGSLRITGCHRLEWLPEGLEADCLQVSNCASLRGFADWRRFRTPGDLTFLGCPLLHAFPERLEVGGNLLMQACHRAWSRWTGMPASLDVAGLATFEDCAGLELLPADTRVGRRLKASGCDHLQRLPERLSAGELAVVDCAAFAGFHMDMDGPDQAFHVDGDLDFADCSGLRVFPMEISVGGDFRMRNCPRAWHRERGTHPPATLRVRGSALIDACSGLTALPERIEVGETLSLSACHGLEALRLPPEPGRGSLEVGRCVDIDSCHGLRRIDDIGFRDVGRLEVLHCDLLEAIGFPAGTLSKARVMDCPALSELTGRISLEGDLTLHDCPLLVQAVAVEGGGRVVRSGSTPAQPAAPAPRPRRRGALPLTPAGAPEGARPVRPRLL